MGDIAKLSDPNTAIEIAAGPPYASLEPQQRGTNLELGRQYSDKPARFIFKKAHMANDDYRIFSEDGHLVCNSWHQGKNPYDALDPLGLGNTGPQQEWESLCTVEGYQGMPGFKIKPKMLSKHGRQFVQSRDNREIYFSVAKESRLKTMSLRHNLEVCKGSNGERELEVVVDMAGRTMQFMNKRNEQVAFVQKSVKALILGATLGGGSEMIIDVAPGMDWTVILAAMMGVQQVGAHFAKDAFGNFVAPKIQDEALGAVGLDGVADKIGQQTDSFTNNVRWAQGMFNMFNNA